MEVCVLGQTADMYGDPGDGRRLSNGYTVTTEAPLEGREPVTGQIIMPCPIEGCSAELELYPHRADQNKYDVERNSVQTARFLCKVAREGV